MLWVPMETSVVSPHMKRCVKLWFGLASACDVTTDKIQVTREHTILHDTLDSPWQSSREVGEFDQRFPCNSQRNENSITGRIGFAKICAETNENTALTCIGMQLWVVPFTSHIYGKLLQTRKCLIWSDSLFASVVCLQELIHSTDGGIEPI